MTEPGALEALISQQIVTAMKAHDAERTGTLRLIKNALKNKAIEKRALLTPAEEQQALATMIKQRRDSIEQFTKGNRPELAAKEAAEITLLQGYMPSQLSAAELDALINEAVAATGAASIKDMGKVMGLIKSKAQGRADMGAVGAKIKAKLGG